MRGRLGAGALAALVQCRGCRHQSSLIAGTVMQGTKLPLTVWFLVIYLLSQAKTGLSALALSRQLGVSYPTAWLLHHKLMETMAEREQRYRLGGHVQLDDAYLGGGRSGGKAGRAQRTRLPFSRPCRQASGRRRQGCATANANHPI